MRQRTITNYQKHPRTLHLPYSPGATGNDKTLRTDDHLVGRVVVVTEKMDGENTTIYSDGHFHARSIDSKHHPSQWIVQDAAPMIGSYLPDDWRLCCENVYAKHSIYYDQLPAYLLVHGLYDGDYCLPWMETQVWVDNLADLGVPVATVPVLYYGKYIESKVRECWVGHSIYGIEQEGYCVRSALGFSISEFSDNVAKYVRAGHIQTDDHWKIRPVEPNKLI